MSLNQSRAEKTEAQLRKPGRLGNSNQQRNFSGGGGKGGGGTAPPPSSSISSNRSFKKSSNGQGSQSRANTASANSESVPNARNVQNGSHLQSPLHGVSDAPVSGNTRPIDSSAPRGSRALPRAPSSKSAAGASDSTAPVTPCKGDASRAFPLQFGTISPGFMNGMQIPARTSSAPPSLDEQKRDQARHDSSRSVPTVPIPSAPKQQQQQQRKDAATSNQSNVLESHTPTQSKRDVHVQPPPAPVSATTQKSSVFPIPGMSMPMPFQQSQVPVQFGGPNPQMQSQGVANSLQMPIPLPVGNATQVQQQVFVPGLQSYPLQPPGMMHQGYASQMSHQLGPQLGNLGIGMTQQYAQQQAGKFGGPRKAVKITHPETHEELRLDKRPDSYPDVGSSGPRPHTNVVPQSQPINSFSPAHQMNFYPTTKPNYTPPSILYPPTSVPLTSNQMTPPSSTSRFNYPVSQGGPTISFMNASSLNTVPASKSGNLEHAHDGHAISASPPLSSVQVTVKPPIGLLAEKIGTSSVTVSSPASKGESPRLLNQSGEISLSNQQNGSETCSYSGVRQQKSISEPLDATSLPVLAKHPSTSLAGIVGEVSLSNQQKGSETCSDSGVWQPKSISEPLDTTSLPILAKHPSTELAPLRGPSTTMSDAPIAVEESVTVATSSEGRRRDPIGRSEPIKDQQKKSSRKEMRQSQQQHQADASDSAGALKLSLQKISMDSSSSDLYSRQELKATENLHPSSAVGAVSAVSLPSPTLEHGLSPYGRVSKAEEGKYNTVTFQISLGGAGAAAEASPVVDGGDSLAFETKPGGVQVGEGSPYEPSNPSGLEVDTKQDDCIIQEAGLKQKTMGAAEFQITEAPQDCSTSSVQSGHAISESSEGGKKTELASEREAALDNLKDAVVVNGPCCGEAEEINSNEGAADSSSQVDRAAGNLDQSAATSSDSVDAETDPSNHISSAIAHEEKSSTSNILKVEAEKNTVSREVVAAESGFLRSDITSLSTSVSSEETRKLEGKLTESANSSVTTSTGSVTKDKMSMEQNRVKITGKKKKKKEFLSKADAAGTTFDLYMAYKGPKEKQETTITSESLESSSAADVEQASVVDTQNDVVAIEDDAQSKADLEDWEDAADISTPKLKTSENGEQVRGSRKHLDEDGSGIMSKKRYTRDFLLTLSEQCNDLPVNFEIGSDIADALMSVQVGISHLVDREPYPSPGRIIDRPAGGSRLDRRGSGIVDDDKWNKAPNAFTSGRDPRLDVGHGGGVINFRPGQGGNHGVLRNPRGQSSGQYAGGILSGPVGSPGGMTRNSPDADRWQRATGLQKGLIPSPQTPLQVMHKAERKYEVGKVSDEEEAKQRQLKAILNKLTPQNFEKLFEQVKMVNIDNAITLTGIISQIFDKALMEPTFCEMYANFCHHLAGELPDFSEDNERITFKRLLLNKCQEEFERGEREQAEANRDEEEGEIKRSEEEREEKKVQARRRMLGNIRLIGELYKKRMLTERIMHECIKKLLGQNQSPDEEDVEALCKLMSTIGEMIDHSKAKEHIDAYFDMMTKLSNNQKLSSRVRFMLKDAIDLRKNKWQQRRKIEGPKKIEEVHRDAAQERQAQTSRMSRGPSLSSSARRGPPLDYGPRGSSLLYSPGSQQMGGLRGVPPHVRGFGAQDVRLEDRHSVESRPLSVPLPQRPTDDDSITLGPQGGLARGMSIRGQPLMPSVPLPDVSGTGDLRRMPSGANGYNSISDWTHYNSRDELMPRYGPGPDRFSTAAYDQSNSQERNAASGNRDLRNADRSFDRPSVTSAAVGRVQGASPGLQNVTLEPIISEDKLRDMSIAAIREFYSARNEDEVRLCIKDLNSPSFYPNMIMLWVTDSLDRKDIDRDLLAKLLVNLSRPRDSLLSQRQLTKGFESVLSTLEDAVTDCPKAADYLGRIFAKVILENVIPFRDIEKLIHEGGDEPGSLLQSGLAADVLVSILEIIRQERGDSGLNEIRMSSNLRLEDFRPPDPIKSRKLDAFI